MLVTCSAARPMWSTASSKRCSSRASSPSIASPRRAATGRRPRVSQCSHLIARAHAALLVAGGDRGAGGEEPVGGLVPRPVEPCVERVGCDRSAPAPRGSRRGATPRRRGSSSQRACSSTSSIDVGERGGGRATWSRARSRSPVDASIQPASSSALARSRPAPASPDGVERGQEPLRASTVAEHDPGPAEAVGDVERELRVVGARSTPVRRRCWRARPGRTARYSALSTAAHAVGRCCGAAGEPRGVGGERALASARRRPSPPARRRGCCRAAGSGRSTASSSSTMTSERLASRPTTSIAAAAGTSSASSTNSTAGSGAPPANVARAHRPRWSSGNSSS